VFALRKTRALGAAFRAGGAEIRAGNMVEDRPATISEPEHLGAIARFPLNRHLRKRKSMSMTMNSGSAVQTPLARGRHDLIGSDRVEGTNVYRSDGKKIGEIERVMIDKMSGQAAYAVMGFGGFLGMGEDHYPIPWARLAYNERLGGYEVNLTDDQLKNAPRYATGEDWKWDQAQGRDIYDYYGVAPYWPMM
jgi:hypothetical protein